MMGGTTPSTTFASVTVTRRWMLALTCCLVFAGLLPKLRAQDGKEAEDLKKRSETLTTKDNIALAATYWPSSLKQDASVVVLLHGANGTQLDWGTLPETLHKAQYAVIAIDLRGHGQSKGTTLGGGDTVDPKASKSKAKGTKNGVDAGSLKARDYEAMVLGDMEAVKAFIYSEHQQHKLNMNKMAIIGAGMGASVGLKYAAIDWMKKPHTDGPAGNQTPRGQDVRALVLLTPDTEISGFALPDAVKTLRLPELQVAMMFGVGKRDKSDKGQTKKLYDQAVTPKEKNESRMYLQEYNSPARGTGLVGKSLPVETNITNFLKKHLQDVRSEWRDRESRLGKKKAT